jgi:hypothetical protein
MKLTQIAGVILAVLVVATGAAAALPGNAPVDAPVEQADDDVDANETEEDADEVRDEAADEDESSEEAADEDRQGPPSEMSSQAPSFVSEVHDLIRGKLDGSISNLGEQISSLTPGGDAGQPGNAGNGPADGSPGR